MVNANQELVQHDFELNEFQTSSLGIGEVLKILARNASIDLVYTLHRNTLGTIIVRKIVRASIEKVRKSPVSGINRTYPTFSIQYIDVSMTLVQDTTLALGQTDARFEISSTDPIEGSMHIDTLEVGRITKIILTKLISKGELMKMKKQQN